MIVEFSGPARRLGIASATAVFLLLIAYSLTLVAGLMSLQSPHDPIRDPYFTMLELLIIAMMPAMVALMVAVHSWAPMELKALSLTGLVFMGMLAGVTSSLHFAVPRRSQRCGRRRHGAPQYRCCWVRGCVLVCRHVAGSSVLPKRPAASPRSGWVLTHVLVC
jgi:hypothetical protein